MPPKDKYTDPKLRGEVKQEIHDGDKGGQPGQWSARKAQMMAQEYKRRGGDYNTDKSQQDESQKNLSKWGEEEWQTKEGSGNAKQEDGTEKRYLPKRAWENMTEEEREETDEKKLEESREGKQHVGNTGKAKESRRKVNEEEHEEYEKNGQGEEEHSGGAGEDDGERQANDADDDGEEEYEDDGEADDDEDGGDAELDGDDESLEQVEAGGGEPEGEDEDEDADEDHKENENGDEPKAGQKRKPSNVQSNGTSKKQRQGNAPAGKVGSKHMDDTEPAPRGSADRLPKKGQKVTWKAMPGYVDGEVTEVLTSVKKVDGKYVKASKQDPRIVMKSSSSGKICVHKPEACFYEDE